MKINTELLIKQLNMPYQYIFDKGLIPYQTKPSGSDLSFVYLDMKREGIFLSFKNDVEKTLKEVTLTLEDKLKTDWTFPNLMPFDLEPVMTQTTIRKQFGLPIVYIEPRKMLKTHVGLREIYLLPMPNQQIAAAFKYNDYLFVESVTFYTAERAKEIKSALEIQRLKNR